MEVPLLPEREEERKWVVVVKTLSFLSAPPAGVACFPFFLLATATMMMGHLGKLSLDGIAITNSTNVTGFIPLFGFASALETLCGQAYEAEQYQKIGTYTYPAMFFCIAICSELNSGIVLKLMCHSLFANSSLLGVPFVSNNLSLEWWSYEILVLLSGILPNPKLETSVLTIWEAPNSDKDLAARVLPSIWAFWEFCNSEPAIAC
ncbi:protein DETOXIFICATION 2 [Citrus sinensis]|nr:protein DETOXIFICATION 2 [Citrus sinensis]